MQTTTRARVRPDAFALALEAFLRAEFDIAGLYLEIVQPATAAERGRTALLRARLARNRGDVEEWFASAEIARRDHPSPAGRLKAAAFSAAACRRKGDDVAADRTFSMVRAELQRSVRPDCAMAAYLVAVDAWTRREYDEATAAIEPFLALDTPDPNLLALLGWIEVKRNRYRQAGKYFGAALESPDPGEDGGVHMRAGILHATLMVAGESADVKLGRRARRAYEAIAWTDGLRYQRSMSHISLRYVALLEGDADAALISARDAIAFAPDVPYAVIAHTQFAATCRLCGDFATARLNFRIAWMQIRDHRWGAAVEDERIALSGFACEAAYDMPAEARKAITMHLSLRAKRAAHLTLDGDSRVDAFTAQALGRIEETTGTRARAIAYYREALAIYARLGLDLRIAIAAADLHRLTHDGALTERIARATKHAPKAWLRRAPTPADALGPKAREILARLLVGESAKMIAADSDRSTFTVSNHTRRIFEVFEVHSRDDLREKCASLGITAASLRQK